jgi:hypothetical protein
MGFRHQAKTVTLVFDDPDLEGLVVKARSMSLAEVNDDDLRVYEAFANALVSWNLEYEDGRPVPMTLEALESYPDVGFVSSMTEAWFKAVSGVDDELGKDSPSGKRSLEASIPMETLSPSLAS